MPRKYKILTMQHFGSKQFPEMYETNSTNTISHVMMLEKQDTKFEMNR